jgi:hypothetical protein
MTITGKGTLILENCVLDECAAIHVQNDGESTTTIRGNRVGVS